MNENQKHLLVFGAIAAGVWVAYRLSEGLPMLPMNGEGLPGSTATTTPATTTTAAAAPATGTASFNGYSNATGDSGNGMTPCQKLQIALTELNKLMQNDDVFSANQMASMKNKQTQLIAEITRLQCKKSTNPSVMTGFTGYSNASGTILPAGTPAHCNSLISQIASINHEMAVGGLTPAASAALLLRENDLVAELKRLRCPHSIPPPSHAGFAGNGSGSGTTAITKWGSNSFS